MRQKESRTNQKLSHAGLLLCLLALLTGMLTAVRLTEAAAAAPKSVQGVVLKNTAGKNAADVARMKTLLLQQKAQKADISAYLNLGDKRYYGWSGKKLQKLHMEAANMRGAVSIKGFQSLQKLDLTGDVNAGKRGQLTSLRVSGCPKLETLYCDDNKLSKLELGNLPNLKNLSCADNRLSSLDLNRQTNLEYLNYNKNRLANPDLRKLTNLKWLFCRKNQLTKLDVSRQTKLETLDCDWNQLTKLDIRRLKSLKNLYCYNNRLTKLDVSNQLGLMQLYCDRNKLTKLDVSMLSKLEYLKCFDGNRAAHVCRLHMQLLQLFA